MEKESLSTKTAFQKALSVIHGSYAFALVNKEEPETIYVAKNKSPLLIGLGEGFNVIASDALAVLDQTHEFVEIADNELVTVTADGIVIEDQKGEIIQRDAYQAQLDASDIEKGTYPFYMLKEIDEQPTVMRKLTQEYRDDQGKVNIDKDLVEEVSASDRIYIVACGTSYNAGWAAKSLLETVTQIPVEVQLSSEFGYNMPLLSERPLFYFSNSKRGNSRQSTSFSPNQSFRLSVINNYQCCGFNLSQRS